MEIVELPNFSHMATSVIQFQLRDNLFVGDDMDKNQDIIATISKYIYFKEVLSDQFC